VRRAAKVLKKKDPGQSFSALCQQLAQCAPETLRREKTLTQKRKTDQLHHSTPENISQLPIPTKFIPLLPSGEKLGLGIFSTQSLGLYWLVP
jgi:hypothetical protein